MVFKHFRRVAGKVSSATKRLGSRLLTRFRSPKEEDRFIIALKKRSELIKRIEALPLVSATGKKIGIVAAPLSVLVNSLAEIKKSHPEVNLTNLYSQLGQMPQKYDLHSMRRGFGDRRRTNLATYLNTVALSANRLVEIGLTKQEIRELCEELLAEVRK